MNKLNTPNYKYFREPWLRMTIRCWRSRNSTPENHFDVGLQELKALIKEYEKIEVISWGVYNEQCSRHGTQEHKEILETLEKCK